MSSWKILDRWDGLSISPGLGPQDRPGGGRRRMSGPSRLSAQPKTADGWKGSANNSVTECAFSRRRRTTHHHHHHKAKVHKQTGTEAAVNQR